MTTKIKKMTIEEVRALPKEKKFTPKKPNLFWRTLLKILNPDYFNIFFSKNQYVIPIFFSKLVKKMAILRKRSSIDKKSAKNAIFLIGFDKK